MKQYLSTHKTDVLLCLLFLPDLHFIEEVWRSLARVTYQNRKQYVNVTALKCALVESWATISGQICVCHICSMPRFCLDVI